MIPFKMQILCLCLLIYIGIYHVRCKRLFTTSVKMFDRLISISILNLIFDILTVYTVSHTDTVNPMINRFFHQVFIGSLDLYIYLVCTYIIYAARSRTMNSRFMRFLHRVPLIFCFIIVTLGPIEYNTEVPVPYSYGWVATTCYVSVAAYLIISLYYCFKYWRQIDQNKRNAIVPALFIMTAVTITQGIYPQSLLSGMGVSMMVFSIFISLENPSDYIDKKSNIYNELGFAIVIGELCAERNRFTIVSCYLKNINEIRSEYGVNTEYEVLEQLQEQLYHKYRQNLFLTYDGCVSIVVQKEKEIPEICESVRKFFEAGTQIRNNHIKYDYEIQLISSKECKSSEEALSILIGAANKISYSQVYMDIPTGVSNRNAYEKDLNLLVNERRQLDSIWYIIIDLNNLKYVNDTFGHSEGDKLLKDCASIFIKYADKSHRVYRIGGDEFCIILLNQTDLEVDNVLAKIEMERQSMNKVREIPISFALGYSSFRDGTDRDFSDVKKRADKMMYQIKEIMKNKR